MDERKRNDVNAEAKASGKGARHRGIKTLIALGFLVFLGLALAQFFSPLPDRSDPALRASSPSVSVYAKGGDLYFLPPGGETAALGLIIYPGARVPKEAYSYLARSVAEAGYAAVLVSVPAGFAIFNPSAASRPIAVLPGIARWVLAGHSLGGVAASLYARDHRDIIAGIAYLGSYPPGGGSLAGAKIQALVLSGTNDLLATAEKIDKAKPLLPESVRSVIIQGGNHAQFGEYGPQRGDGVAEITPRHQQSIVVESVLALLASSR